MSKDSKRPRGRPPIDPATSRRTHALGLRVTPELAAILTERALIRGHTQSQEAARLIELGALVERLCGVDDSHRTVDALTRAIGALPPLGRFTCANCGEEHLTGSGTGRRSHAQYCSDKCRVAAARRRVAANPAPPARDRHELLKKGL